jgi:DNA-binding NarL/FixJ family response regulator
MRAPSRIRVLVAHSDPLIAIGLTASLRAHGFGVVVPAPGVSLSVTLHTTAADLAVADYDSGTDLLAAKAEHTSRVLILTCHDGEAEICRALERGVDGYLLQGCSVAEVLDGIRSICDGGTVVSPLVAVRVAERMKQHVALTTRELDILRQMMLGMSNKSMASALDLAVGTVKSHVKSVLQKLGASNRTHAVAMAQRRGILSRDRIATAPVTRPKSVDLIPKQRLLAASQKETHL